MTNYILIMLCIKVALYMAATLGTPAFKQGLKKGIKQGNQKEFFEKIPEET
jgi:hypothetical protein